MEETKLTRRDKLINGSRKVTCIKFDEFVDYLGVQAGLVVYGGYARSVRDRISVAETMNALERTESPYIY